MALVFGSRTIVSLNLTDGYSRFARERLIKKHSITIKIESVESFCTTNSCCSVRDAATAAREVFPTSAIIRVRMFEGVGTSATPHAFNASSDARLTLADMHRSLCAPKHIGVVSGLASRSTKRAPSVICNICNCN